MARRRNRRIRARLRGVAVALAVLLALLVAVALRRPEEPQQTEPPVLQQLSTEAPTQAPPSATQGTESLRQGWMEADGKTYYYESGVPVTGVRQIDGKLYCFDGTGARLGAGWQTVDGERYYLSSEGVAQTGWQTVDGQRFYFREKGAMARGEVEIGGVKHYFTSTGREVVLVNPWNYVPEDYQPELMALSSSVAVSGQQVDKSCYDDLVRMMNDGKKAGHEICVVSSYRTHDYQAMLYENQVLKQMANFGYTREEAEKVPATVSAIPGTSEHQLGLAVDIVDTLSWDLSEIQETLPGQIWLMENSWRYGFILRYPNGKTAETGIIYEPWHYRYVGAELAEELHSLGLTLEAYLDGLTAE